MFTKLKFNKLFKDKLLNQNTNTDFRIKKLKSSDLSPKLSVSFVPLNSKLFYAGRVTTLAEKFQRDIKVVLWLSAGIFFSLALFSFNPEDPSLNSASGVVREVHNFCGIIGSFLADFLYQSFGLSAWCFVALFLRAAYVSLLGIELEFKKAQVVWAILFIVCVSSLSSLYITEKALFNDSVYVGGLLGHGISILLSDYLNKIGVGVMLWTLTLISFILYTEKPIEYFFRGPRAVLKALYEKVHDRYLEWQESRQGPEISTKESNFWRNLARKMNPKSLLGTKASEDDEEYEYEEEEEEYEEEYEEDYEDEAEEDGDTLELAEEDEEDADADPQLKIEIGETSARFQMKPQEAKASKRKKRIKVKQKRRVANWEMPQVNHLEDPPLSAVKLDPKELKRKTELLEDKLSQFNVKGKVTAVKPGPAVTMFEYKPNSDVKISKITELADDLSLALSSESVRIIAPIPGRDVVGIETSNSVRETVYLKEVIAESNFFSDDFTLPLALGKEASGHSKVVDLRKMPHLMVAGTTGSGKSVFVVGALTGLLFKHSPETLKLILVDPKQVDLVAFHKVPHLIMPPIREVKKAVSALKWAIKEMDKRYRSMSRFGARNLEEFNEKIKDFTKEQLDEHAEVNEELLRANKRSETYHYTKLPYIVIVVEEFGDLMAVDKSNVEASVVRLAQMARACGIHLVLAMQSPRKDVVTGLIKTNIPGRISFKVASKMDSRIILDESGAERLLARGDMLYLAPGVPKPMRHHGPWVSEDEISSVMNFWAEQCEPEFDDEAMKMLDGSGGGYGDDAGGDNELSPDADDRYDEILSFVSTQKSVSASYIQRKFRIGYPRAARLIEIFENEGVVGPANGSKPREVLIGGIGETTL